LSYDWREHEDLIVLETVGLAKTYDNGVQALINLHLRVDDGQLYCLVGPNGAGKSTTISLFLNYIAPTAGAAFVDQISVSDQPLHTRRRLAYVPEQVALYGALSARQNLTFFARLAGHTGQIDYKGILDTVGLDAAVLRRRVQTFSKGMKQRLALAIAIAKGARNLVLDEPTSGLDPRAAADFLQLLARLRGTGHAILISSHDLFHVREIADSVGIMRGGTLCAQVTASELSRTDLHSLYMDAVAQ
jgi:ABC-2 type transport system ATP-binding protein